MARNQVRQSEALRKARERQRELDRKEDERRAAARARVAEATAVVIVSLQRRNDVEQALEVATAETGAALRALLDEDVDVERAAALLDLDVARVRRLLKAARPRVGRAQHEATGSDADTRSGRSRPREAAAPPDQSASAATAERRAS